MSLEVELRARLTGFSGLLIAARQVPVYPVTVPQEVRNPVIRYARAGAERPHHMGGDQGAVNASFQIDAYADDYGGARKVAEGVRAALQNWAGGGVEAVFLENETEDYEAESKSFRVMLEFQIWYREPVS